KLAQPACAAELAATLADAVEQFGLIPHPDLAHLDARAKDARQLSYQIAEIHPRFGREIDEQASPVVVVFAAHNLDIEAAFLRLCAEDGEGFPLLVCSLILLYQVSGKGAAQDLLHLAHDLGWVDLMGRLEHLGYFPPLGRIHDDVLVG